MTAKHAVYLAIIQDSVNLDELQSQHRSLQVRRIGRSDYQIRFKDSEPWLNLDDWAANYRNSLVKQLADLVTADLQVLPPEELISVLPKDSFMDMVYAEINALLKEGRVVHPDKYNELRSKAQAIKASLEEEKENVRNLQSEVSSLKSQLSQANSRLSTFRTRVSEEFGNLQDGSKLGAVSTKALNETKERLGL